MLIGVDNRVLVNSYYNNARMLLLDSSHGNEDDPVWTPHARIPKVLSKGSKFDNVFFSS